MIKIQFSDHSMPSQLVDACLIAAGFVPVPTDTTEREAFHQLANQIGDGLDRLPHHICVEGPDVS